MGPFIQPRPVIFSYLLAAMLVVVIQHKERLLWSAVPIIWIWAAVHGSWVIGGALILLEFLRTFDRRLFFAGLIAGVSTLATAHGLGTWQIVLDFFGSRETLSLMEEWNVPEFTDFVQAPYLLLIFGVIVAGIRSKITVRDLVVILPFLVFGMSSRRAVFPAAIVLLPWAALAIPPVPASRSGVSRGVVVAAGAVFGLVALSPMLLNPLGQLYEERFPSPEIVEALGDGRAFHGDGEGGYLIYATWPEREVYIDDRAELYGIDHFREYRDVRSGVYREAFERWGIEAVLAQAEWALTDVLTADGWTVVASDEYFTVFQRP